MKNLLKILSISLLLAGCATFAPKPGMSVQELNSMASLSFDAGIKYIGNDKNLNADVYETGIQNMRRTRGEQPPKGGWQFFYFRGGRLVDQKDIQATLDQQAAIQRRKEQDKAAALAKQQSDAQARAAQAQKDEAVKKEQQKTLNKLNEM